MIPDLPHLVFLDIRSVIIHEHHDSQRTAPLAERIRTSGLFRNPPILTPLDDGSGRYMVLDGANRVTALRELGFPHVLAQTVEADSPGLKLENWNHVIWEIDPEEIFTSLRKIPDLDLNPVCEDHPIEPDLWGDCGLALVQSAAGEMYSVCTPEKELVKRVDLLNALVDCYKDRARLDRTGVRSCKDIKEIYSNLSALVIFPQFKIREVLSLAGSGYLLPTGITRFTVSPRALHINYPLYELAVDKPLEVKNAELEKWIQKRIAQKGVRYYAEPTFLFDE